MEYKDRVSALISLEAIVRNARYMASMPGGGKMVAVIKADAYGHGAKAVACALKDEPYLFGYAVATAEEAMELSGLCLGHPILILGPVFEEHWAELIEAGVRFTVTDEAECRRLSELACSLGTGSTGGACTSYNEGNLGGLTQGRPSFFGSPAPAQENGPAAGSISAKKAFVHLAVDTGMGRIGLAPDEASAEAASRIAALPGIALEGVFTHMARADEADKAPALVQVERFNHFLKMLDERGVEVPYRHIRNSAGILRLPEAGGNLARAGVALYGLYPSDDVKKEGYVLHPAMSLVSRLSFVKEAPAGTTVSYGGTFTAGRPMRIGTVPVGYADGYPRGLSGKGEVIVKGVRVPILGRICMDQFMVCLDAVPDAKAGDTVTLLGRDGEEAITAEELGDISGRFNYELACCISKRVPRRYV